MGKPLIQQRRGKGSSTYRSPKHRLSARIRYINGDQTGGIITDIISCRAHSSPIVRIRLGDGSEFFNAATEGIRKGQEIRIGDGAELMPGNILRLGDIPEGTQIFNIESKPGDGGKFVRASGLSAKVVAHDKGRCTVLLPSKKRKEFSDECKATIGIIAGSGRTEKPFVKAGKKKMAMKAKNKLYPRVSGAAMNAIDHPFGGKRSSRKGRPTIAPKNAPAGRKVGMLRPRRTGRRKR